MLAQLLSADLFSILLVFARVGSALMLLPGFGEVFVAPRIRLLLAGAFALALAPVVAHLLPKLPATPIELFVVLGGEIAIGVFLGALARFIVSALHTAGVIIGLQTNLASAQLFDPASAQQGSLVGGLFYVIGVLLIFITNLHHQMLMGIVGSYGIFVPGAAFPVGDFTDVASRLVSRAFAIAMQIAAPYVVIGLVFYIGLGLISRLMPQVQMFFIAVPLQILLSFVVMAVSISAGFLWFLDNFSDQFAFALGRG